MEDRFVIVKDIDEGAFGKVIMAKNKDDGSIVAIKKMFKKYATWDECVTLREVKSLMKLKHQNIIKLHQVLKIKDELNLVFEYVDQNIYKMYQEQKKTVIELPLGDP